MASGKESPRQKMIGMMYLVLTALLALNVSKEILLGFVSVDESIENSKVILSENNEKIKKAFEEYVNQGNYEAKPYLLKAIEAQSNIRKIDQYIDSMKLLVIQHTEGFHLKDTSQLRYMGKLDNYDTPTYLLIGSDETSPKTSRYSAADLKLQLTQLHGNLTAMIDNMQKDESTKLDEKDIAALKQKLNTLKPDEKPLVVNGVKLGWELRNFYNMPMAAVITTLDKIQVDIKNTESEFLHVFSAASSKFMFKVTKLQAEVIAPTAYVLAGQPFAANVVLSASSSELTPEKMKVFVDAEYDSISKKLTVPGSSLTVKDGVGQYETSTNSIGQKELKGVIVYQNNKGVDEYYPFNYNYTVAPPFSTVAAENMNILYAGIDNPVNASCAGFSPNDLKINAVGCGAEITPTGSGKYIIKVKSAGTCSISVSAKVNGTYQTQGPIKTFRVKDIPPPVLKIGGKLASSNLEFTRNEIRALGSLGAESVGFMFPANFVVKSFEVVTQGGGVEFCPGNSLSTNAKAILNNLRPGQVAYIDNIKVQTPKQTTITIPVAKIKVKA